MITWLNQLFPMSNISKYYQIGIVRCSYPEIRNFAYAESDLLHFQYTQDAVEFLRKIWHRIAGVSYSKFLHSFAFPLRTDSRIFHCFNFIVFSTHSWVVTFETTLPRYPGLPKWILHLAWSHLASNKCRAILALSECSKNFLLEDLELNRAKINNSKLQSISNKIRVLHPPQSLLIEDYEKDNIVDFDGTLNLVLVGHDFFRKGGLELLIAVDTLLESGFDIELKIVSKMSAGDYASRAGNAEVVRANTIIEKYPNQILLKGTLPNEDVLDLLRKSHIVCLPTWGETYGYSVLEGQAAGCPAITTNLRALPEINNSECGWVIEVPKLPSGDGDIGTPEKRKIFQSILIDGIKLALEEALNNRQKLREKSRLSLKRIRDYHDPKSHQSALLQIYSSI
ncbi:MAG: glycosyltransferase [Moorea sp. SIO2I5]|nr:glycosyltransferase [Moorena sp. SIO2I5]